MKLMVNAAGAMKPAKPRICPLGTPTRTSILNFLRGTVSLATITQPRPTASSTRCTSNGRWMGLPQYSATRPAMPGPRPKPRRKNAPAAMAATARLAGMA